MTKQELIAHLEPFPDDITIVICQEGDVTRRGDFADLHEPVKVRMTPVTFGDYVEGEYSQEFRAGPTIDAIRIG